MSRERAGLGWGYAIFVAVIVVACVALAYFLAFDVCYDCWWLWPW